MSLMGKVLNNVMALNKTFVGLVTNFILKLNFNDNGSMSPKYSPFAG
jgi:hypothetical protein